MLNQRLGHTWGDKMKKTGWGLKKKNPQKTGAECKKITGTAPSREGWLYHDYDVLTNPDL
jgi:hypothetical protein